MNTSTYYNLNLVEGTDIVNPLTTDVPNYETIDEQMHNNAIAGVTLATEVANGTTHALIRENSECAVIRFVATSNWSLGDTITVDGIPVVALLPSGEVLPSGAYVINANVLCILTGTNLTVYVNRKKADAAADIAYKGTTVENALNNINNKLTGQKDILSVLTSDMTVGENVYDCNWQDYELLVITMGSYWNSEISMTIPTTPYFGITNSGSRPIMKRPFDSSNECNVYQAGQGKIALRPSENCVSASNFFIRIYGVIKK